MLYAHLELLMDSQNMHSMRPKCVYGHHPFFFFFLRKRLKIGPRAKKEKEEKEAILLYYLQ
jgi:hypothetical protein